MVPDDSWTNENQNITSTFNSYNCDVLSVPTKFQSSRVCYPWILDDNFENDIADFGQQFHTATTNSLNRRNFGCIKDSKQCPDARPDKPWHFSL